MNIDQILQQNSDATNSYVNDDFKSSNSPEEQQALLTALECLGQSLPAGAASGGWRRCGAGR